MKKWFWQKEKIDVSDVNLDAAKAAKKKSDADFMEARERDPEVKKVARTLREIRQSNHFAEQLRQALGGH